MPRLEDSLMEDEIEAIKRSCRCKQCGHLDILHNGTRQRNDCEVSGCECLDGKLPCEECGVHGHKPSCEKWTPEPAAASAALGAIVSFQQEGARLSQQQLLQQVRLLGQASSPCGGVLGELGGVLGFGKDVV